jgi:hypothetical protein
MRIWVIVAAAALAASGAEAKAHKRAKAAQPEPAASAPRDPNGAWSIEATTTVGNCPALIPTELTIADNKIENASGASVSSWGYVDESGNIVARFTGAGEHVVRFHGALKGGKGSGAWSSSTDMCGGTWKAAQQ